ncbi:hypothetical protein CapIbe_006423 [Capra ibex]
MAETHTPYYSLKKLFSFFSGVTAGFLVMVIILTVEIMAATVVLAFFPVLKCCGVKNYTDFSGSSFERVTGHTYPWSCCKSLGTVDCDGRNVSADIIHQELPGILATLLLFIKLG